MTDDPGLLLAIQTADCIPVLVADRKRNAVAAFHAGWRGTVKRIVELGIGRMRFEFGSQPEDLIAAIGPGVGAVLLCRGRRSASPTSNLNSPMRVSFSERSTIPIRCAQSTQCCFLRSVLPVTHPSDPLHLDLVEANRRQLIDAGLKPSAISRGRLHQLSAGIILLPPRIAGPCGRMLSVIGIRTDPKSWA